jgi:hypothetical protein
MASTESRILERNAGMSLNITGASQPGSGGGSLPPSGTMRVYTQPPIMLNWTASISSPCSAHIRRTELLIPPIRAPSLNGDSGSGKWLGSRVQ